MKCGKGNPKTSELSRVKSKKRKVKRSIFLLPFCFLLFTFCVFSQTDLPGEIRGYKVYKAKISVTDSVTGEQKNSARKDSEAVVKFDDPQPADISLSGVTFEIGGEISNLQQSGKIDFLTFENFRVNDLPVEIEEYREPFEVSKNEIIHLPKPVKIVLSYRQALRGVLREQNDSKKFWRVTGRVFVFGHFKKGFFKFKRVVPVDINLQIKNPVVNGKW